MGELLYLSKKFSGRRHEALASPTQNAQILFFTGVRYQKYTDFAEAAVLPAPKDKAGPGHSKTGRKRRA